MKTNVSLDESNHNLVMFPSSKNFKIDLGSAAVCDDPLNDLLTEYDHLKDEDIPYHLDDRFGLELEHIEGDGDGDVFHSLEAFMSRNLRSESQHPDDRLIQLINERILGIKEAKERIKFYLGEIDMFLPSRRK